MMGRSSIAAALGMVLVSAAALGAMTSSTPDANSVFQPFVHRAASGQTARGQDFAAGFTEWRISDRISYDNYGQSHERDTQAVFLLAGFDISEASRTIMLDAIWLGASGRRYATTARLDQAPGSLAVQPFNPGLSTHARAVFELPRDEILGGHLLLARRGPNVLGSVLQLAPPADGMPPFRPVLELRP